MRRVVGGGGRGLCQHSAIEAFTNTLVSGLMSAELCSYKDMRFLKDIRSVG